MSFEEFKLDSFEPLLSLSDRAVCPQCKTKKKYFCYKCCRKIGTGEGTTWPHLSIHLGIPDVKLPLELCVVHHPAEKRSKSTAVHAKVLAPDSCNLYEFPDFPEWDPAETLLLFPSDVRLSSVSFYSK